VLLLMSGLALLPRLLNVIGMVCCHHKQKGPSTFGG